LSSSGFPIPENGVLLTDSNNLEVFAMIFGWLLAKKAKSSTA